MGEQISRLMDGELDGIAADAAHPSPYQDEAMRRHAVRLDAFVVHPDVVDDPVELRAPAEESARAGFDEPSVRRERARLAAHLRLALEHHDLEAAVEMRRRAARGPCGAESRNAAADHDDAAHRQTVRLNTGRSAFACRSRW